MSILVIFITGKENGGNYRHLYSRLKDLMMLPPSVCSFGQAVLRVEEFLEI
jgi:hypothetical protein